MTNEPYKSPDPMIAASILAADFSKLAAEIQDVDRGGADFLHLDIMDGHFVNNISFGPPVIESIRPVTKAFFDVHMMISSPLRYAPELVKAGANSVTFQVETTNDPAYIVSELRKLGCGVGITLNPATPADAILPVIDQVDLVLVMSVVPGFGGQHFMPHVLPKCEAIKKRLRADQRLEIDGGINMHTVISARNAGVDWFVIGSAIFDEKDRATTIARLRAHIKGA